MVDEILMCKKHVHPNVVIFEINQHRFQEMEIFDRKDTTIIHAIAR